MVFTGNARDHSEGRVGVSALEYEAYESQVVPRLAGVAAEARSRWPVLARVAAVSSPHRDVAFDACRWCIDSLKSTVPIWKRETWDGGESWGLDAQHVVDVDGSADVDAPVDRAESAGAGR